MTSTALLALTLAAGSGWSEIEPFVPWYTAEGGYVAAGPAGCKVWDPRPSEGEIPSWAGACDEQGYAKGRGTVTWHRAGVAVRIAAGVFDGGFLNGQGLTTAACPGAGTRWFRYGGDHWMGRFDGVGHATFCDGSARWLVMDRGRPLASCPREEDCAAAARFDADAARAYVAHLRVPPMACRQRFPEQAGRWREAIREAARQTSGFLPPPFWTDLETRSAAESGNADLRTAEQCLDYQQRYASPAIRGLAKAMMLKTILDETARCLDTVEDLGERYRQKALAALREAAPLIGPDRERAVLHPRPRPGLDEPSRAGCEEVARRLDTPWPRLALSDEGARRVLLSASRTARDMHGAGQRRPAPGSGGDLKGAVASMLGAEPGDGRAGGPYGARGPAQSREPEPPRGGIVGGGELACVGPVDRDSVQRVLDDHHGEIRRCYEQRRREVSDLAGELVLRWILDADGDMQSPELRAESTLTDEPLVACVKAHLSRWGFSPPRGGAGAVLTYRWTVDEPRERAP